MLDNETFLTGWCGVWNGLLIYWSASCLFSWCVFECSRILFHEYLWLGSLLTGVIEGSNLFARFPRRLFARLLIVFFFDCIEPASASVATQKYSSYALSISPFIHSTMQNVHFVFICFSNYLWSSPAKVVSPHHVVSDLGSSRCADARPYCII